jgi:hypothetical protein
MKRRILSTSIAALFFLLVACNYSKPSMYVTLTNNSGVTLRNVEVKYPGGIFGMSSLGKDQTNRRLVQITSPCVFTFKFDVETGNAEPHQFDFGDRCPKEIVFTVESDFSMTRRIAQP